MTVSDYLVNIRVDVVERFAPVVYFPPSSFVKVFCDFGRLWMIPRYVAHARHNARSMQCRKDPVEPDVKNRHQALDQAQGIKVNCRAVFVATIFFRKCRLKNAAPSLNVGKAEHMVFGPMREIFRLFQNLLEVSLWIPQDGQTAREYVLPDRLPRLGSLWSRNGFDQLPNRRLASEGSPSRPRSLF